MDTQLAEPELTLTHKPVIHLIVSNEPDQIDDLRPMAPARGIILGVMISIPLWAFLIFLFWKIL